MDGISCGFVVLRFSAFLCAVFLFLIGPYAALIVICQVVPYGRLYTKENVKHLALNLARPLKADLHATTLSHATSLRQACDMSEDHLHANDIFIYKMKYAKVCTGIYGAKVLTTGKKKKKVSCPAL